MPLTDRVARRSRSRPWTVVIGLPAVIDVTVAAWPAWVPSVRTEPPGRPRSGGVEAAAGRLVGT